MLSHLKSSAQSDIDNTSPSGDLGGYLVVALVVIAITLYAVVLHIVFYRHNGPFYDSLSYLNHLAWVTALVREGQVEQAFTVSIDNSTIFLPWLQAILIAPVLPPSRIVGIFIQALWLMILALASFHYLRTCKRLHPLLAIAFTIPIIAPARLFGFNGGLSDFRMDLLQYLLMSTTGIFFLAASETRSLRYWLLCGLFAGLSCLGRSTSLVFLLLIYVPLMLVRLALAGPQRKSLAKGAVLMIVVGALCCGWYYIANLPYLHYYYFLWNPHANAKLPIIKSAKHFLFMALNLGQAWIAFGLCPFAHGLYLSLRSRKNGFIQLNWRYLWIGLVPCTFLVLLGAGRNPIVSMPSIFGLCLFMLLPVDALQSVKGKGAAVYLSAALLCLVLTAQPAIQAHRQGLPEQIAWMPGILNVEDAVLNDMKTRAALDRSSYPGKTANTSAFGSARERLAANTAAIGSAHERLASDPAAIGSARERLVHGVSRSDALTKSLSCIYCLSINNRVLINTFIFDKHFSLQADKSMTKGLIRLFVDESLEYDAALDWAQLKGNSDQEKVKTLCRRLACLDYLVVPTEESARYIERNPIATMNLHVISLRDCVLSLGKLTPVCQPIELSPYESVVVYRNDHPLPYLPSSAYVQPVATKNAR